MTKSIPRTFLKINLSPTTANKIKIELMLLSHKTPTKLLKICSDYISVPLSYLCNQSLTKGTFPEQHNIQKLNICIKRVKNLASPTTGQFHY
jgi:hypothetical protein